MFLSSADIVIVPFFLPEYNAFLKKNKLAKDFLLVFHARSEILLIFSS